MNTNMVINTNLLITLLGLWSIILVSMYLFNQPPVTDDATWATLPWGLVMVALGFLFLFQLFGVTSTGGLKERRF